MEENKWYTQIPESGILCKCKRSRIGSNYIIDIITRYNPHPLSSFRFKPRDITSVGYEVAIPLTIDEAYDLIYRD